MVPSNLFLCETTWLKWSKSRMFKINYNNHNSVETSMTSIMLSTIFKLYTFIKSQVCVNEEFTRGRTIVLRHWPWDNLPCCWVCSITICWHVQIWFMTSYAEMQLFSLICVAMGDGFKRCGGPEATESLWNTHQWRQSMQPTVSSAVRISSSGVLH